MQPVSLLMSERGFALLEVLIAAAVASLMLGAVVVMTVTTGRFGVDTMDQTALQRLGTSVINEMARQIQTAGCTPSNPTCTPLQITTCNGVPNSLRVTNPDWNDPVTPGIAVPQAYCFRRNVAGEPGASDLANTKLVRDWEKPPGTLVGTFDLLTGALIAARGTASAVTTVNGPTVDGGGNCGPTAGFCPGPTGRPPAVGGGGTTATVTARLRFQIPETNSYQVMTFTTTIVRRYRN